MSQSLGRAANTLLSPNEILKLVNTRYSLGEAHYCDLIRRGFNDHYSVEFEEAKYIFRVYLNKYYIEAPDAFQFELDLLEHLHQEGVPVAHALRKTDGELLGWTSTALGERAFALFSYAAGEEVTHDELMTLERSFQLGKAVARLHLAANSFKSNHKRYHLDLKYLVDEPLRLMAQQEDESARVATQEEYERNRDMLASLQPIENLVDTVKALETSNDEFGIVHGDLHPGNIRFDGDQVTFFDFDHCAYGWRAYDVGPLSFLPEAKFERFLEGYESVRPLSRGEHESLPVFAKLRMLWDMGDMLATTSLRADPS